MNLAQVDLSALAQGAKQMTANPSLELPVNKEVLDIIDNAAVDSGFAKSTGQFQVAMKHQPISTLILFVAFVGGSNKPLGNQ